MSNGSISSHYLLSILAQSFPMSSILCLHNVSIESIGSFLSYGPLPMLVLSLPSMLSVSCVSIEFLASLSFVSACAIISQFVQLVLCVY